MVITLPRACGSPLHPPSLPTITAPQQSDDIETPLPAISSLRSRFEKLAADSSAPPPDLLKPSTSLAHLTASPAPRVRPLPAPEHDRDVFESGSRYLHATSSSSDLRTLAKRPPPPPPLRPSFKAAPSPAPNWSPLLCPVSPATTEPDTSDIASAPPKPAALAICTRILGDLVSHSLPITFPILLRGNRSSLSILPMYSTHSVPSSSSARSYCE